eukprot:7495613-Pyramimonas_sp.AAC.1
MSVLNGPWYSTRGMKHYCKMDGSCCSGRDAQSRIAVAKKRLVLALKATLFRIKPSRPAENKWSKLAP